MQRILCCLLVSSSQSRAELGEFGRSLSIHNDFEQFKSRASTRSPFIFLLLPPRLGMTG